MMKPIIIPVDKEDNVILRLSELQKILDEVYKEGKKDGHSYATWTPPTTPTWITTTTPTWTTTTSCGSDSTGPITVSSCNKKE